MKLTLNISPLVQQLAPAVDRFTLAVKTVADGSGDLPQTYIDQITATSAGASSIVQRLLAEIGVTPETPTGDPALVARAASEFDRVSRFAWADFLPKQAAVNEKARAYSKAHDTFVLSTPERTAAFALRVLPRVEQGSVLIPHRRVPDLTGQVAADFRAMPELVALRDALNALAET